MTQHSVYKKVFRSVEQGVKVKFQKGLTFEPKPSLPKFVDPQDVDFEMFLSRLRVHTPPGKGKQRIVYVLCSLNEATVKRKFIELETGGCFDCTRPDLTSLMPSVQTPLHLRHLYHHLKVVEFSHTAQH
jgi:hypothetical protein